MVLSLAHYNGDVQLYERYLLATGLEAVSTVIGVCGGSSLPYLRSVCTAFAASPEFSRAVLDSAGRLVSGEPCATGQGGSQGSGGCSGNSGCFHGESRDGATWCDNSQRFSSGGACEDVGSDLVDPLLAAGDENCKPAGGEEVPAVKIAGKWAASNRRKKDAKKRKAAMQHSRSGVPLWRKNASPVTQGFCETVVSQSSRCPSYSQALSDAEREAKDTLAQRRAAENKVARKLAEMKLASLEDEKRCQEYADLRKSRIIQWTNEATAKSQQSLEKCKSIDPSSSASQHEIREQAKQLEDEKERVRNLSHAIKNRHSDWQVILQSCEPAKDSLNTEYLEALGRGDFDLPGTDNGNKFDCDLSPSSRLDAIVAGKNEAYFAKLATVDMDARRAAEEARKLQDFAPVYFD